MADREYSDFDIAIEAVADGRYRIRVIDSPVGRARAEFELPFSSLELDNFLLRVGRPRRGVRRLESPEATAARDFGRKLWETVFTGDVAVAWQRSTDQVDRDGRGLRVRLRLDDAPDLSDLPWEYLYQPTDDRHLVLSAWTPLVRFIDLPRPAPPLAVTPPLRLLAMVSSPSDYPTLDTEAEWNKLNESLADLETAGLVEITRLEQATLSELQRALRKTRFHIFHYIGHSGYDEAASDGVLMLETDSGRARKVTGRELSTILSDARSIRLAVLNSCEGARASAHDPFSGSAQSLVAGGIPAVVAMQFEITDEAAIVFSHELYAAVADGYPIDAAVAESRRAIFGAGNDVEWGTPVLYMRSGDGRIFDIGARHDHPPTADPGGEQPGPGTVVVGPDNETLSDDADVDPPPVPDVESEARSVDLEPDTEESELADTQDPPVRDGVAESSVDSQASKESAIETAETVDPVKEEARVPTETVETVDPVKEEKPVPDGPARFARAPVLGILGAVVAIAAGAWWMAQRPDGPQTPETTVTSSTATPTTSQPTARQVVDSSHVVAVRAPAGGFTIDGNLDDWAPVTTAYRLIHDVHQSSSARSGQDPSGVIMVAYDQLGLYIAVEIEDDMYSQLETGDQIWRGDAVNIQLSTVRPGQASTTPDQDDFQLTMTYWNADGVASHAWFQGTGANTFISAETDRPVTIAGTPPNPTGNYTLEAFIPWGVFLLEGIPSHDIVAMFAVFDNDGELTSAGRPLQRTILGNVPGGHMQQPKTWGTLSFD